MRRWLIPLLFTALFGQICAQTRIAEIDKLVAFCQENGMFNGTILVAENGAILYHRSIGMADFEKQIPLHPNMSFCLGSISKQFTAFGIMLLQEQGKLEYTDTVGEIFPELPKYMHRITLKNLMQHTSGLRRTHYEDDDGLTNQEIFQNLMNTEGDTLLFEPGTDLSYSNSGYMLLAMIIEKVSGQSYESFLREYVWQPLGMTHTFVMNEENRVREDRTVGYNGFGKKADFNVLTYGSNGIYASAEDLFRWSQSLSTDAILPFKNKSKAWEPAVASSGERLEDSIRKHRWNYGYGLFVYKDSLQGVIGHSGTFGGFLNIIMKDLDNNRDVVVLSNNGRMLPILDMGNALQYILRGLPFTYPRIAVDLELRRKHYDNIDLAIQYYHYIKEEHPNKYEFDNEWALNSLGYALLEDKRIPDAIKIFKLLIAEFPKRPNPYDSLGEAYYRNGQYSLSIKSYERALEIDKNYNLKWIKGMLQKNREKLAEQKH